MLNYEAVLQKVSYLAYTCQSDKRHVQQVTRLSLCLFDELLPLHKLDHTARFWLHIACLLHDIGWIDGARAHHKASLRIILTTPLLPFSQHERLLIGSIARYHRKALPDLSHDHYRALSLADRQMVSQLAAFLRLADGLDETHQSRVRDVECKIGLHKIHLVCYAYFPYDEEEKAMSSNADLFKKTYHQELVVEWRPVVKDSNEK